MKGIWVSQGSPEICWLCVHGKYDYKNIVWYKAKGNPPSPRESRETRLLSSQEALGEGLFSNMYFFLYSFACGISLGVIVSSGKW
jgi:hypothetical protein